jgi:hypothetical protein
MNNIQDIVLPEGWTMASARESWGVRNSGVVILIKSSLALDEDDQNWIYRSPERDLKVKKDLLNCFSDVGAIHVKEIPNEYEQFGEPWFIITTRIGPIKIGWRKRVIAISWEDSDIVKIADDLFPDEDTTKYHRMIHAWSHEKAAEYLKVLHS